MRVDSLGSSRIIALSLLTFAWISACGGSSSGGSGCAPQLDLEFPVITFELPPLASVDAGENQAVNVGDEVSLDATTVGSDVEWSFLSKPIESEATLAVPTNAKTSFVADRVGVYELEVLAGVFRGIPEDAGVLDPEHYLIARDVVTVVAFPVVEPCGGTPEEATVIEDVRFRDDDWESVVIEPEGISTTHNATGSPSGGIDDQPFRVMIDTITNPDLSHPECSEPPPEDASCDFELTVFHWSLRSTSTYDIATQGPVEHIDYVEHQRVRHGNIGGPSRPNPNVEWAPAIRQGDVVYAVPAERLNPDGQWREVEHCGLEADDFLPPGLDLENGEELTFGYARTLTNDIPDTKLRVDHAIGSFRYVLSGFAEPSMETPDAGLGN